MLKSTQNIGEQFWNVHCESTQVSGGTITFNWKTYFENYTSNAYKIVRELINI